MNSKQYEIIKAVIVVFLVGLAFTIFLAAMHAMFSALCVVIESNFEAIADEGLKNIILDVWEGKDNE